MRPPLALRGHGSRVVSAFTLVELLVSAALLSFIMLILAAVTESASRAWREGQGRTETFQSARTALEIVTREITPAIVDTRMQFVVAPGDLLSRAGAPNVAPNSPAILWMAPLGDNSSLCCVGYYLFRDEKRGFYRLKRIFLPSPTSTKASPYFPQMTSANNPRDPLLRTSPVNADWFTRNWNGKTFDEEDATDTQVPVSTATDNVIAFWVQCLDVLGKPIPLLDKSDVHPTSELFYNSAAYFETATSNSFDNGRTFLYLRQTAQSMKANRVPAAVDLTLITIDSRTLARGVTIPDLPDPLDSRFLDTNNATNVEALVQEYQSRLKDRHIYNARTFSTRAKLVNGN